MENEQLLGESCCFLFFRSKKMQTSGASKGSGVTFHKNRCYTRTIFYQCKLPILSDGSVSLEWQPDVLQPSTRAVNSAMAHHCTFILKILLHRQHLFIPQRRRGGSTKITLVPENIWKPSITFFKFFYPIIVTLHGDCEPNLCTVPPPVVYSFMLWRHLKYCGTGWLVTWKCVEGKKEAGVKIWDTVIPRLTSDPAKEFFG